LHPVSIKYFNESLTAIRGEAGESGELDFELDLNFFSFESSVGECAVDEL